MFQTIQIPWKQNRDLNCDKQLQSGTELDSSREQRLDERVKHIPVYLLWGVISRVVKIKAVSKSIRCFLRNTQNLITFVFSNRDTVLFQKGFWNLLFPLLRPARRLSRKVSLCWPCHSIFIVSLLGPFSSSLVLQSAEAQPRWIAFALTEHTFSPARMSSSSVLCKLLCVFWETHIEKTWVLVWFVPLSCLMAYNKLMSHAYFFLEPTPMNDVPAQNTLGSAGFWTLELALVVAGQRPVSLASCWLIRDCKGIWALQLRWFIGSMGSQIHENPI